MKKSVLLITMTVFTAGAMLTSCQTSAQKVENAENKVAETKMDLVDAKANLEVVKRDTVSEYQQYKVEMDAKLLEIDKSIEALKVKIAKENKADKAQYEKSVAELEQKNSNLKKKMSEYNQSGKKSWASFKTEFNHDMDELGQAIKDVTVNNVK